MTFHHSKFIRPNGIFSVWGVCCLLLLLLTNTSQLNAEPAFQFHTLDKKQGLASSVVYDIAEDRDGFIWFATEDGLQKYDGFEFINYRHSRLDKHSISSNIVRKLLVDNEGNLWIGTENGLNLYHKEFDSFERIDLTSNEDHKIGDNKVRSLYQTKDNTIWVGTISGLNKISQANQLDNFYPLPKVRSIFEDDLKQLWIGTLGEGLFLFERGRSEFVAVIEMDESNGKIRDFDPSELYVIDIFQDSFGRLLIATWGNGVYRINGETRKLIKYSLELPSEFVRVIHQDELGQLWFGTLNGIVIENIIEDKQRMFSSKGKNIITPVTDNVFKIFQGSDKTIWVGTYSGGVSWHHPASRKFESYGISKDLKFGLADSIVLAMSENSDFNVWIGTQQGKLSLFYPNNQQFESHPLTYLGQTFEGMISAVYQVNDNLLLVGTELGLFEYRIDNKTFTPFLDIHGNPIQGGEPIKIIHPDLSGRIWVGFKNKGLQALILSEEGTINIDESLWIDLKSPQAILNVSKDQFLVGTIGDGVVDVNINSGSYELVPGTKGFNILSLAKDKRNRLWVATWAQGIKILAGNEDVISLDEDSGLVNNTVYSIIYDPESDKMWTTTNQGMVAISTIDLKQTRFGFYDGLQGDEFNRPGFSATNGFIYFGGLNGFSRFYPNSIEKSLYIKSAKIIGLSIANKEIKISQEEQSTLNRSLLVSNEINLQHDQTPFSIDFTSPQFVKPSDIEFRYRFLGLDDRWITATKDSRRATYTNISPGEYFFEVQVRDINSEWNDIVERKKIIIHPPLWLTNIAKVTYFLIIALILGSFVYLNWKRRQADLLTQKTVEESEKRLKLSLWGGGNEIWDWNLVTGEVLRSDADKNIKINCSILSRNLKELSQYIHQYDVERVRRELLSHLSGETDFFDSAYRIKDAKLGWQWIQDRAKVVERDENNVPTRMSGTQRDVSEIHRKDAEIERLGQAFRTTSDGVWIRDSKWRLIECNPSYEKITRFTFIEKKGEELWFPDVAEQQANIIQRIRLSLMEKGNWQGEVWAERKESDPFPQKLTIDTILDEKGYVRYYVGVFSDITFHKRAEEEFRKLANFDSLTGLPNRACLYDRLNQTINKTKIRKERFAILVIDIDNFKRVNDSLGHSVGDTLITEVAKRLTRCNREEDTIARVGGDEFVIIRDDIRSATEVASFAELMLKELNMPVFIKGQKLNLNFSIGITLSPEDGLAADKLLRNADTAMYEAKKEVLNSYHFYSIELNQRARKKLALENDLRSAIDDGAIDLAYQPKVDMKTGRVCGMEALARWNHPIFGFVNPEEFISLAEETGLILSLGHQLLRKAIVQAKCWVDDGIMRGRMCVNLSAHQFWHRDLASEVSAILKDVRLDAKNLELELTESACIQELDQTVKQMLALRELGIHLALDDFGTGYSSLAQLKTLPLDTLKVDKSFIQNIQNSVKDANIVKAIIDIANSLDLEVVIEGVETKQQCDHLWQSRASVIQGYFFSKPVNPLIMAKLLSKKWDRANYLSNVANNVTPLG